jgi:acetyl esterase
VAGDSAGGNLAAVVALMARDRRGPKLALQALIYPAVSDYTGTASYHENDTGFGLSRDAMIFFWRSYLGTAADGGEPYASPLRAADLKGVARALVITAQYDPLRDDGLAYAARLSRAGVAVRTTNYLDMNHGFVLSAAAYDSAKKALDEVTGELRAAWGKP